MTEPAMTGTVIAMDGSDHLVLTRRFPLAVEELWRWLTDSRRLELWIGRWEGDPASGRVSFFMTAEGDVVEPEEYAIIECSRPHRFAGDTGGGWHLWFELAGDDTGTALRFGQRLDAGIEVGDVGPGWEYYLDRLRAATERRDAAAIVWDDYYPSQREPYQALRA